MSVLDAIFRRIFRDGSELTKAEALDFLGEGLTVEYNKTTRRVEVSLDGVLAGLSSPRVRAATISALPANTRTGNVLTANAAGALASVDGVTLVAGDSVLVKDEATAANNGRYTVTSAGGMFSAWVLTRHTGADSNSDVRPGMGVLYVEEGTQNVGSVWALLTPGTITLNTTALTFVLASEFTVDPMLHGAKADGVTNDKAAILAAINAAVATGRTVVGGGRGRVYGISGNLELPSNTSLQDIKFKQLTPAAVGDLRTLTSDGAINLRLVRVTVDRNGDGTAGTINDDAGCYFDGGSGHYFEDVDVSGDDMGTGFVVLNASNFECVRVCVHDMSYDLVSEPADDSIQGIWFASCSNFTVIDPKVFDLGGDFGDGATTKWSRGLVFAGCSDFTVVNPRSRNVEQGLDVTGSGGNVRFTITGGCMQDCYTWGCKFANTARDGTITGLIAERCGASGFVVSGPGETLDPTSSDLEFVGCVAYDTGSSGVWSSVSGFRVIDRPETLGDTRGIRFLNCKAHDRQDTPTMQYGFMNGDNEGVPGTPADVDGRYNEAIGCRSIGHTIAAFAGMHQGRVDVSLAGGAQSIPDNTWTLVAWNTETDLGAMYTPSDGQIWARRDGDYQVTVGVSFAASALGQRGVRIVGNGGATIPGAVAYVDASAAGDCALSISWLKKMIAGDEVRVEVFQNSGGALDLRGSSAATVQQVT